MKLDSSAKSDMQNQYSTKTIKKQNFVGEKWWKSCLLPKEFKFIHKQKTGETLKFKINMKNKWKFINHKIENFVGVKSWKSSLLPKEPQIFHKRMSEGRLKCKINI